MPKTTSKSNSNEIEHIVLLQNRIMTLEQNMKMLNETISKWSPIINECNKKNQQEAKLLKNALNHARRHA